MGKQKNRLTATKPHYHFARIFASRSRRMQPTEASRMAVVPSPCGVCGRRWRELQGSPGPRPRPSPTDLPCTDRPSTSTYPRPTDLPCTAPRPAKPGGLPQRASGRWRMPCGGPSPLLAGWRGLTSRPNHFCQLDSKTTHTDFATNPTQPSKQQHGTYPRPNAAYPTPPGQPLRAGSRLPSNSDPATLRQVPKCYLPYTRTYPTPPAQLPYTSYPTSPTLYQLPYIAYPISATLYHVPPTLHPSPGRGGAGGGPTPSQAAGALYKIPPSTKAPS
jgi:hypothetical protein